MPDAGGQPTFGRRRLLGAAGAGGAAAALSALLGGCSPPAPLHARSATSSTPVGHTGGTRPAVSPAGSVHFDDLGLPVASWVVEENARPGTTAWLVSGTPPHGIEGFASDVSAVAGDVVTLYVNTSASRYFVDAYRLGWYQGRGGRLVASLGSAPGSRQPAASVAAGVNMVECRWRAGLSFSVERSWPPGYYLLKLTGDNGYSQWVPLVVRDDASEATFVVQSSVTTWQAYNLWGGYSLYGTSAGGGGYSARSRVVSFDRPYPSTWENGSADLFGNEYPFVALAERHGLDVTYWTDIDLHRRPGLLSNHRALVSLGHDEYWSSSMRFGTQAAVDRGLNFAVLGANCCYRHIRLEASPVGPDRREVCYKVATEDPLYGKDDSAVTANWPDGPDPRPECALIGVEYQAYGGSGSYVVVEASSQLLTGTGLQNGDLIPGVLGSEFDSYVPRPPSPANFEIICHATTPSAIGPATADMGYFTKPPGAGDRPAGGGVFASGTAAFVNRLWANSGALPVPFAPVALPATPVVSRIALNVLAAFARGPASDASLAQPSRANWQQFYASGSGTLSPVEAASL